MSDAPERIAFRWEVGAAITSGPLMNHPDYVHYVRADRIEELEAKLAKAVEALELSDRAIMDTTNDLDLIRIASVFNHMCTIRTTLAELKGQADE